MTPIHSRLWSVPFLILILVAVLGANIPSQAVTDPSSASHPTAILVSATNEPLRVMGSDGMEHLNYDLVITNAFAVPVTLTSLEVLGAEDGRSLLRLEGDALAAVTQPLLGRTPTPQVPASGTVAVVIDLVLPLDEVPERVTHLIAYDLPADALGAAVISSREVDGPELAVNSLEPVVIASPLRGAGWLNLSGCCDASALHRSLRLVTDGARYIKPEMFAIDWVQLQDGQLFSGDGSSNEQYFGFGAEVYAVADGTVVSVRSGMPETPVGQPPTTVEEPIDYVGDHVVVQIRPDVWATYAHLQTGSVTVEEGETVTTGQLLGTLGSTGNSTAPHLHFQLSDGPDNTTANSVPFVLERYILAGTVDPAALNPASTDSGPPQLDVTGPSRLEAATHPLYLTVQDFE